MGRRESQEAPGAPLIAVALVGVGCAVEPSMRATLVRRLSPAESAAAWAVLALWLGLYAACVRLAARLLGSSVSWKHAFVFAFAIGALTIAGEVSFLSAGVSNPLPFSALAGISLHLVLGGWFFGRRMGWRRSLVFLALALVLFAAASVALWVVASASGLVH